MAKLIYVVNVSLDGYIEDAHGGFEWTAPTDEVFTFITGLVRRVGTFLYGRRLYETMAIWEADTLAAQSELRADFANVWQAAPAGSAPVDSLRRSKLGPRLGRPSSTSSPQPPLGCLTDGAGGAEGTTLSYRRVRSRSSSRIWRARLVCGSSSAALESG